MKRSTEKQLVAIGIRRKGERSFKYQTLDNKRHLQAEPKSQRNLLKN